MPVRPPSNMLRIRLYNTDDQARRLRSSPKWQGMQRAILRRDPVCCNPLKLHDGVVRGTTEAHHVEQLSKHPEYAFDMRKAKGLCGECHDAVGLLQKRGISTQHLFGITPPPNTPLATKACSAQNNGFYCARMKSFRSTKCAGCDL